MTENPTNMPQTAAQPAEVTPEPARDVRPRVWPRIAGAVILLAGAGGTFVWLNPGPVRRSLESIWPHDGRREAAEAAIKAVADRVAKLEQTPVADLGPIVARLAALEKQQPDPRPVPDLQPVPDLRPVIARLDALEAKPAATAVPDAGPTAVPSAVSIGIAPVGTGLGPLLARLDALEHRPVPAADERKVDAIASQVEALSARDPGPELRARLDDAEKKLGGLATTSAKATEAADRAALIARLQGASAALTAGRPLGATPGAPPALARFATSAPPTIASLRLAFPAAEQAALKVSKPDLAGKSFANRILGRLQDFHFLTVREGDRVLLGNTTAAHLTHARTMLDAGDLDGAVKAVSALSGPPADAIASWLGDAKALLAAREALTALSGPG